MESIMSKKKEVTGYPLIIGYLGCMLMIIGTITLLPLLTLLFYPQDAHEASYFIIPGILSIMIGYLLYFNIRGKAKGKLQRNQDAIIVVSVWMLAIFIGALPFVLSGSYNLTQGIFETTSAWSTTGLTVVNVDVTSHLFLMHRSTILFFGGIGLVIVMLSVLSDSYGMRLYNAEGHNDRLLPNLLKSSRIIISIYSGIILGGILLYLCFGMNLFDAIIHSIGAVSTGGFSTHGESIAYYKSFPIELITIVLMILGNINFLAHLFLLKGKFRRFFHYCEIRFSLILIAFITPIVGFLLMQAFTLNLQEGMRVALFQVVTALTTTGFQTVKSFATLPSSVMIILIVLQLIGGGIGSTAGGIKQYRICIIGKSLYWRIRDLFYSKKVVFTHKISRVERDEKVSDKEVSETGIYIFLYMVIFFIGSFILTCYGNSIQNSMFDFSSALSTVGLSSGIMCFDAPSGVLWTGTFGMFIGRLEIFVVILATLRTGKDIRNAFHRIKKKKKLL